MCHFSKNLCLIEVDLLICSDEVWAKFIRSGLDHIQNSKVNRNYCWMHATHVEFITFAEEILQSDNLLRIIKRCQQRAYQRTTLVAICDESKFDSVVGLKCFQFQICKYIQRIILICIVNNYLDPL